MNVSQKDLLRELRRNRDPLSLNLSIAQTMEDYEIHGLVEAGFIKVSYSVLTQNSTLELTDKGSAFLKDLEEGGEIEVKR